ncbi:hypothetical protein ElyMa_003156900 [Elysia marginata]|uniref:Ion transport domain-containing protein n=1 Tax=Elysia marginata TaxID=1093978 RepID=A0AAV4IUZ8_9GAST|nr:hypothetical protein ElyMa_003156900 [Elysia marginata]
MIYTELPTSDPSSHFVAFRRIPSHFVTKELGWLPNICVEIFISVKTIALMILLELRNSLLDTSGAGKQPFRYFWSWRTAFDILLELGNSL